MLVLFVVLPLPHREPEHDTAPRSVTQEQGEKPMLERVIAFRASMSMVKEMLDRGIITDSDFRVVQERLKEKYGFSSRLIFAENA